ncbi:MAG: peptide chain release factor N(5)-glutamine methyltransferase, partial [Proteobacteria bacterium]|nr:peptide chain release factor N(5)-glutamine methyltransferase [Pseudomonadota bacterium]
PELNLSESDAQSLDELIDLRKQGYPIAYLINNKEFWSMKLKITADTLIPRPETELLVETALEKINKDDSCSIIDLGTGSGAIAIAIASERPLATVTATDINNNALQLAMENAKTHKTENITFKNSNWFEMEKDYFYDLILSNPPYISANDSHLAQGDVRFEPVSALVSGEDGLNDIKAIISDAIYHLKNEAWLILEHGFEQGNAVRSLMGENNIRNVSTIRDYSGHERITLGQWLA